MKTKLDRCAVPWVPKVSCQLLMEVKRKVTSAFLSFLHFFSFSFSSGNNYDSAEAEVVLEKSIIWQIRQCDRQSKRERARKRENAEQCLQVESRQQPFSSFECTSNCRCRVAARICMPLTQLACLRYFAFLFTHFLLPGSLFLFPSPSLCFSLCLGIVWSNWKKRIKTKKGKYFVVCTSLSHPPVECWKSFYTLRTFKVVKKGILTLLKCTKKTEYVNRNEDY